jgi:hypothetical protein
MDNGKFRNWKSLTSKTLFGKLKSRTNAQHGFGATGAEVHVFNERLFILQQEQGWSN